MSGSWFIEGVREELDSVGEWHWDAPTRTLSYYASAAGTPPTDLVAAKLQTILSVRGSKDTPVKGVTIKGVGFRDAASVLMERWGVPSGGDWALHNRCLLNNDSPLFALSA
jgi:hypothetical protein